MYAPTLHREKTFPLLFSAASRSILNKTSKKKYLYCPDKNFYHVSESIIPAINLIVGSINVVKFSKIMSLSKLDKW